jgi:hypothetical protein
MSKATQIRGMNKTLEGGVFYPTGYIVAALASEADAERLWESFLAAGYDEGDCILVPPVAMLAAAEKDLDDSHLIALLGSSIHARKQHLKLAEEGCHFLLIYAPSEAERTRVLRVLRRVPVRYLIHYHHRRPGRAAAVG